MSGGLGPSRERGRRGAGRLGVGDVGGTRASRGGGRPRAGAGVPEGGSEGWVVRGGRGWNAGDAHPVLFASANRSWRRHSHLGNKGGVGCSYWGSAPWTARQAFHFAHLHPTWTSVRRVT